MKVLLAVAWLAGLVVLVLFNVALGRLFDSWLGSWAPAVKWPWCILSGLAYGTFWSGWASRRRERREHLERMQEYRERDEAVRRRVQAVLNLTRREPYRTTAYVESDRRELP